MVAAGSVRAGDPLRLLTPVGGTGYRPCVSYGGPPSERLELERRIVGRAFDDPEYRARLLSSPREAVAEELGFELPDRLQVEVVEERTDRLTIVLPVDLSGIGHDAIWAMTGRRPERAETASRPSA